ncbi:MAG TPA: response regulator, partial [Planctomycetaceae bacterium]|nr:response regulator [Planctomycetaceae bacterium]
SVESELGVGSTFTLTFLTRPMDGIALARPREIISSPVETEAVQSPRLSGRILVVDDRRDMRFVAQHMIEDAGGTVEVASNGLEAIRKIEQAAATGKAFDLIAMDMQMPVLDGYEATRRLRASGYTKPIVAVTAHAMEGDRQLCVDAGCTDYISKPLDQVKFLALLAAHLRHSDRAELPPAVTCRVLVIDDAKDACESLKMLLSFSGHEVETAYDGKSGIAAAVRMIPAAILIDLGLPDMSGFEVLRKLKGQAALSETLFIAATGRDDAARTIGAGFDHHLQKPLNIRHLEKLINDHAQTSET